MEYEAVRDIAKRIHEAGGRALVVGGYVRDHLLGIDSKDLDVEVYGLPAADLEAVLSEFGQVIAVGRAFGVLRVKGIDVDFALPRRDSKVACGHRGFLVEPDPELDFAEASRRRDLTINSMGLDPLSGEILDPHGGRRDLEQRILRATDPRYFAEDPLRGLRAAQFAARFEMRPDETLIALCRGLDLSELPPERIFAELEKLLLKGQKPSLGLTFLYDSGLLKFFPELKALVGVSQDPEWHPEGDVWVHTLMVVNEAARLRDGGPDDAALMFGALCHDLGKPSTTYKAHGRIRSPGHDSEGVAIVRAFLQRLRAPGDLTKKVEVLTRYHLAPMLYVRHGATARAYRRLARQLDAASVSIDLLYRLARADHLGRTTREAGERIFPAGDTFLEKIRELDLDNRPPQDVVQGRHLIARGLEPGPEFSDILARCRELQDEKGWDDPERILDAVMDKSGRN